MFHGRSNIQANGVTPLRWLLQSNPLLAEAITARIGDGWPVDLEELHQLEPLAEDESCRREVREIKQRNKDALAAYIEKETSLEIDRGSLFDVQVKRLHEYKRQLLNVLHVVALYLRIKKDPGIQMVPSTVLFGGKAAPAYAAAKLVIKLVNSVGEVIN